MCVCKGFCFCISSELCVFWSLSRYLLLKTHQLPLDAFLVALRMMQVEDVDIDEVQCILANLIYMVRTCTRTHTHTDVCIKLDSAVCFLCPSGSH